MKDIDVMTVEVRAGKSHGLRAPTVEGSPEYMEQLADMLALCRGAKPCVQGYSDEVKDLLRKYAPGREALAFSGLMAIGFNSWRDLVLFVKDDKCVHMGLLGHKLVTEVYGAKPKKDQGFIDGEGGIGFYTRLMERMDRGLEKAFDEKYYWQARRPLQWLRDHMGLESAMANVHYAHPSHWRYPAGHGMKFAVVYDYVTDSYELTADQENAVFTILYAASMARSGGGVHLPEDNCASWSMVRGCAIDDKYMDSK